MILQSLRLRHAARRYASRLPSIVRKDYGASEFYTPAQIAASVRRAQLPPEYISIAYAAYLPETEFHQVATGDYAALRALFQRYGRFTPAYGFEPAPENTDAFAGSDLSGSGGINS